MKQLLFLIWVCLSSLTALQAINIDQRGISLLEHSEVYIDADNLSLEEILKKDLFSAYSHKEINIGVEMKNVIWIKLSFENSTHDDISKILLFSSPFLENIFLYDEKNIENPRIKGQARDNVKHKTLKYYFTVNVPAGERKTYYMKVYSEYSPVRFTLMLEDKEVYLEADRHEQLVDILLVGFIMALMIYSFIIGMYLKEKSYFYYGIYLLALLYFQVTYVGLTQVYIPYKWVQIDRYLAVPAVYFLLISTVFFAISFLKIKNYPKLYNIYMVFIALSLFFLSFFHTGVDGGMNISIIFAIFLIIYNFTTAVYVFFKGYTQARFYVLGFGIVLVSYMMIIADSLAWTSIMESYPNLLLWTTAVEALILSLAFADGYMILQKEKESINAQFLEEASHRENMVQKEVVKKTAALNLALEGKELLLQEVHHRVKNNLQIILSIIQLKNDELSERSEKALLVDIENRINAISKTYEILIVHDDLQRIDMQRYLNALLEEVHASFESMSIEVKMNIRSNASLPLKEAVYVGLIINELVTNAFKYAFEDKQGNIRVSLMENAQQYELYIEDDGKGFVRDASSDSLGLKLMETLVEEQLKGGIEVVTEKGTRYHIYFSL